MPASAGARRRARPVRLLAALALLGAGFLRLAPAPTPAAAAVGHRSGYQATVDGFTSWYGSYDLGALGPAWCIDHGIRAPDPDLGYVPTDLAGTPEDVQVALAWAFGRYGVAPDRPSSAALMLFAHDLMGATYPSGRLDVATLTEARVAGFGEDVGRVLWAANALKVDALAHAHLRPPWELEVTTDDPPPGTASTLTVRLTAAGVPVEGIEVRATAAGTSFDGDTSAALLTSSAGTAGFAYVAAAGPYRFEVTAVVPNLDLDAFAPTVARAQRVARAATLEVRAALDRVGMATTTTSTTTSTSTSTTVPPTTSTSTSTSTSTTSTSTSTTSTSSTSTSTTSTSTSTTTTLPATSTAPASEVVVRSASRELPRTGADPLGWTCVGAGLVLLGAAIGPRRGLTTRRGRP